MKLQQGKLINVKLHFAVNRDESTVMYKPSGIYAIQIGIRS